MTIYLNDNRKKTTLQVFVELVLAEAENFVVLPPESFFGGFQTLFLVFKDIRSRLTVDRFRRKNRPPARTTTALFASIVSTPTPTFSRLMTLLRFYRRTKVKAI